MLSPTRAISDDTADELRRATVACQMDDLNALAEAVVAALNAGDEGRAAELRVSMERFVFALAWNVKGMLPAIVDYAGKHKADDLFAPAFVLQSIAPEAAETADLLGRLSPDAHALTKRLQRVQASP